MVMYSVIDKASFQRAEDLLARLHHSPITRNKATILVANKIDLVRSRAVSTQGNIFGNLTIFPLNSVFISPHKLLYPFKNSHTEWWKKIVRHKKSGEYSPDVYLRYFQKIWINNIRWITIAMNFHEVSISSTNYFGKNWLNRAKDYLAVFHNECIKPRALINWKKNTTTSLRSYPR